MNERPRDVDYRGFFVLGMCLISLGVTLMTTLGGSAIAFLGSGITFMTLGSANRHRWTDAKKESRNHDDA